MTRKGEVCSMNNRWIVLATGCLIQTVLGGIYAWSTFVPYLVDDYGLGAGRCGFIFGLTILTFSSAMIVAGRVMIKKGPRFTALIAGGLFMCGYLLASMSSGSFIWLLASIGIITGGGIGFGYVCPLSVGMKWFPNRKGLVTGVAVAGFGAGAILLSSIAEYFLVHGMDVLVFFRWYGLGAGVILIVAALFLSEPPLVSSVGVAGHGLFTAFGWPFFICVVGLFAGTFAGLLIIGNLAPLVLRAGLTEGQAALSVSIFAIGNGLGRIIWGKLFDHWYYKCIPLSLGGLAVAAALLLTSHHGLMMLTVSLIGFCFGANFVIYASTISRYFGTASFPRLYPVCFMAYGIAGVIGPGLGGYLADATGTYHTSIYICMALVIVVGILSAVKLKVFSHVVPGSLTVLTAGSGRDGGVS
ncbi:MAG: MFS transporter [Spartobacteria bacterium]|nr:MFS transporter [Spartobacteria bacterium]